MREFLSWGLTILATGGAVYCLLVLWSAWRFHVSRKQPDTSFAPPVSLLKPVAGLEPGLERNLETFFQQDYPNFELLFAVTEPGDLALETVHRLRKKYPAVRVTVLTTGRSPYVNRKVYSLEKMAAAASSDFLIISDSDAFVDSGYIRGVVAPFADPKVGVVTCPYRGVAGKGLWSRMEALAMTTEFIPGIFVAEAVEGMKFALGPTMAVRRSCLNAIGGFAPMAGYLADDFLLGQWAAEAGYRVVLSHYIVDHQVVGENFWANFRHRLRWARSTRFSRPLGYLGQGFTYPFPIALCLFAVAPASPRAQELLVMTLVLRLVIAWFAGYHVLGDRELRWTWWVVPLQDVLSFSVWCGGFTGRQVIWRDIPYFVERGGLLRRVSAPEPVPESELTAAGQ